MSEIIYLSFSDWFCLALYILVLVTSFKWQVFFFSLYWWLINIPLRVYMYLCVCVCIHIHVCVCVCVCVSHIFFIHSSFDGHLGSFHSWAIFKLHHIVTWLSEKKANNTKLGLFLIYLKIFPLMFNCSLPILS